MTTADIDPAVTSAALDRFARATDAVAQARLDLSRLAEARAQAARDAIAAGASQADLARRIGVGEGNVSRMLKLSRKRTRGGPTS